MEMNQVRYFLAVCRHRNFTHAAQASNVSQPALTTAIKKLEEELGGVLFLRDRSGCRLTSLGDLVRPRLERLVAEAAEAKAQAARHLHLDRVPIVIGLGETIGQSRVVDAVGRFRRQVQKADVELIIDRADALVSGLQDGRIDVAITSGGEVPDLYRADDLYDEGYRVVMAGDHSLAADASITLAQLADADLLDRPNCEMRNALHAAVAERDQDLYAAYRSNRVDWLLSLARKGAGVVVLPETAIPDEPGLISRPIVDAPLTRTVRALRYRHQPSRPEVEGLVRDMRASRKAR